MAEYYDYILGLIPLTAIGTAVVLALVGESLSLAIPVGAGLSIPLIAHALFVRTPVPTSEQSPTSERTGAQRDTGLSPAD